MIALQLGTPAAEELQSLLQLSGLGSLKQENSCEIVAYEDDLLVGVGGFAQTSTAVGEPVFFIHPEYANRELAQNMMKLLSVQGTGIK
jgi:hypothetical protein